MEPNKNKGGRPHGPLVWKWTPKRTLAAILEAEDRLTDKQIAAKVKISTATLFDWRQRPEYMQRVDELQLKIAQRIIRRGIANPVNRLRAQDDRRRRLQRIMVERSKDPAMANIPGGKTGLIVRQQKVIGVGASAQRIDEYAFDHSLFKAFADIETMVAKSLGQLVDKMALTNPDGTQEYGSEQQQAALLTEELKQQLLVALNARLGVAIGPEGGFIEAPAADRSGPPVVGWDGRDATGGVQSGSMAGVPAELKGSPDSGEQQPADRQDLLHGGPLLEDGDN